MVCMCEGGLPTSMVVDERYKHPSLCGYEVEGVIIHTLSAHTDVLPTRQTVLILIVPLKQVSHIIPTLVYIESTIQKLHY